MCFGGVVYVKFDYVQAEGWGYVVSDHVQV